MIGGQNQLSYSYPGQPGMMPPTAYPPTMFSPGGGVQHPMLALSGSGGGAAGAPMIPPSMVPIPSALNSSGNGGSLSRSGGGKAGKAPQAPQASGSSIPRNKGIICSFFFDKGTCPVANCPFAHLERGCRLPVPDSCCNFYQQSSCLREKCRFFHGSEAQLKKIRETESTTFKPEDYMAICNPYDPSKTITSSAIVQSSESATEIPPSAESQLNTSGGKQNRQAKSRKGGKEDEGTGSSSINGDEDSKTASTAEGGEETARRQAENETAKSEKVSGENGAEVEDAKPQQVAGGKNLNQSGGGGKRGARGGGGKGKGVPGGPDAEILHLSGGKTGFSGSGGKSNANHQASHAALLSHSANLKQKQGLSNSGGGKSAPVLPQHHHHHHHHHHQLHHNAALHFQTQQMLAAGGAGHHHFHHQHQHIGPGLHQSMPPPQLYPQHPMMYPAPAATGAGGPQLNGSGGGQAVVLPPGAMIIMPDGTAAQVPGGSGTGTSLSASGTQPVTLNSSGAGKSTPVAQPAPSVQPTQTQPTLLPPATATATTVDTTANGASGSGNDFGEANAALWFVPFGDDDAKE